MAIVLTAATSSLMSKPHALIPVSSLSNISLPSSHTSLAKTRWLGHWTSSGTRDYSPIVSAAWTHRPTKLRPFGVPEVHGRRLLVIFRGSLLGEQARTWPRIQFRTWLPARETTTDLRPQ